MSPDQLLRTYLRSKDENRPHLLDDVFSPDARLEIHNRSDQIAFPAVSVGLDAIADVLVRRFNQAYENIYSFCLDRPGPTAEGFTCDWLVGMTAKSSRSVRVGCGRYDWTFDGNPALRVSGLVITIEQMVALVPGRAVDVLRALSRLDYPWTSARRVASALLLDELAPVIEYFARGAFD